MEINTRWFRDTLADKKMSQRGLARAMGLDAAAVSLMLRGKREMRLTEAAEIARLLGVPAEDVLANAGVRIGGESVKITGFVDEHGEIHLRCNKPIGTARHPGGELPAHVTAIQCRTAGSPMAHMDGWVLFIPQVARGIASESVGRLSMCKIRGGVIYLAKPTRSYTRGLWDMTGPAMDAKDVELEFASPVLMIQT